MPSPPAAATAGGRHDDVDLESAPVRSRRVTRILRGVFVLSLGWATLVLLARPVDALLRELAVVPGARLRAGLVVGGVLGGLAALAGGTALLVRAWPGFLRVRREVSWTSLGGRFLVAAPAAAVATGLSAFAIQWVSVLLREDPAHSQYGLSAWFAAGFYALALTPAATVVGTWWSLRGAEPGGEP